MNEELSLHEKVGYIVEATTLIFLLATGYVLFHAFSKKGEEKENGYHK